MLENFMGAFCVKTYQIEYFSHVHSFLLHLNQVAKLTHIQKPNK